MIPAARHVRFARPPKAITGLLATRATTREGVLARFEALLHFVAPEDNPDARVLLESCLGDLRSLWL